MEPQADDHVQLLKVALAHAHRLAEKLAAQRDDLVRVAPNEQEGAGKLARFAQTTAEVERGLDATVRRHTRLENQP